MNGTLTKIGVWKEVHPIHEERCCTLCGNEYKLKNRRKTKDLPVIHRSSSSKFGKGSMDLVDNPHLGQCALEVSVPPKKTKTAAFSPSGPPMPHH
jgi:hypothetical protein